MGESVRPCIACGGGLPVHGAAAAVRCGWPHPSAPSACAAAATYVAARSASSGSRISGDPGRNRPRVRNRRERHREHRPAVITSRVPTPAFAVRKAPAACGGDWGRRCRGRSLLGARRASARIPADRRRAVRPMGTDERPTKHRSTRPVANSGRSSGCMSRSRPCCASTGSHRTGPGTTPSSSSSMAASSRRTRSPRCGSATTSYRMLASARCRRQPSFCAPMSGSARTQRSSP